MNDKRRCYWLHKAMRINGVLISEIVIDPHTDKHSDHIDDQLILEIVELLMGRFQEPIDESGPFFYHHSILCFNQYFYRMIWLMEKDKNYIGIITLFRDRTVKKEL